MPEELRQEVGRKVRAASLVDVQPGAVVSRELISKPQGTVTIFAFDQGQGLSEHTAPFDAIVQILDGSAEIVIDNVSHLLISGESIIMPANIPHAVMAVEKFKMMLIMVKG
jgi:quercetin dioxygenase-like cupin family protein